jgi:ubiquinol-cytochrome c reductase cytochrome c subunit
MGRMFRGRYAIPAALLASVGIFGLMAFSPSAAQADSTTPTTVASADGGYPYPTPTSPTSTTSPTSSAPSGYGTANITLPESFIAPGQALFDASCASCHGADASGTSRAPNLQGLGAGTVDFWVSTGRMPLAISSVQAAQKPSRFNRSQTLQIAAFVQSRAPGTGMPVPIVNLSAANLEAGGSLFTLNCAACHTITGAGDALAGGSFAPSLHLATPTQIIEAIRSGPGNMPRFSEGNLTPTEVHDIAAYVHGVIQHPDDRGGFGLGGIGPVGEGFVGLLVGVGLLMLVCFWIGERT